MANAQLEDDDVMSFRRLSISLLDFNTKRIHRGAMDKIGEKSGGRSGGRAETVVGTRVPARSPSRSIIGDEIARRPLADSATPGLQAALSRSTDGKSGGSKRGNKNRRSMPNLKEAAVVAKNNASRPGRRDTLTDPKPPPLPEQPKIDIKEAAKNAAAAPKEKEQEKENEKEKEKGKEKDEKDKADSRKQEMQSTMNLTQSRLNKEKLLSIQVC